MTLFLGLQNDDYTVVVADRRITRTDTGAIESDETGKCGVVIARNAWFAYAYTGLATWDTWNTTRWLRQAICGAAAPDYLYRSLISRLADRLAEELAVNPALVRAGESDRGIAIGFFGFEEADGTVRAFRAAIVCSAVARSCGAFQPKVEARFDIQEVTRGPLAITSMGGNWPQVSEKLALEADALLAKKPIPEALYGKALDMLRIAHEKEADEARAHNKVGNIGRRANYIVLSRNSTEPTCGYDPGTKSDEVWVPDLIVAVSETQCYPLSLRLQSVATAESPGPAYVAKSRPREPCSCGSGKPYKLCHGRRRKRPLVLPTTPKLR